MKTLLSACALVSLCVAQTSYAEEQSALSNIDIKKIYVGGGFNRNIIDSSSVFGGTDGKATGFQAFAGYKYDTRNGLDIAFEAGIIQTNEFYDGLDEDADGIWAAAVVKKDLPEIHSNLSGLARLGYGLGGDDGLLMGFGAQYQIDPQVFVRLEYVNKDLTQSYQVNAVYHF